jgi:SAM-dependent methyltransferase
MKQDGALEEQYWRKELQAFREFMTSNPGASYRDWQPTKWQALLGISAMLTDRYGAGTALELGCGSATLLLQLAGAGWHGVGVDRSASAISLASAARETLDIANAEFAVEDFGRLPASSHDLVFSIGVIEHLDEDGQLALLDLHFQHASKAVLIGIPNLASPVFRSFIQWARRNDRLYEDDHHEICVPELAERLGKSVRVHDGAHLFLGRGEYFIPGDAELDAFYAAVAIRLADARGPRYAAFPRMDFGADDIDMLARVEQEAGIEERLRYGFLNYYLME